jgi:hypothetical protein
MTKPKKADEARLAMCCICSHFVSDGRYGDSGLCFGNPKSKRARHVRDTESCNRFDLATPRPGFENWRGLQRPIESSSSPVEGGTP